jgi:hypothetical protein
VLLTIFICSIKVPKTLSATVATVAATSSCPSRNAKKPSYNEAGSEGTLPYDDDMDSDFELTNAHVVVSDSSSNDEQGECSSKTLSNKPVNFLNVYISRGNSY